jgi:hypothetical protein
VDSIIDTPPWIPASSAAAASSTLSDNGRWPLRRMALIPAARLFCHSRISSVTMACAPGGASDASACGPLLAPMGDSRCLQCATREQAARLDATAPASSWPPRPGRMGWPGSVLRRRRGRSEHMTASPGIPSARIVPCGRTRDGVTMPPPHPPRRSAPGGRRCDRGLHRLPGPGRVPGAGAAAWGHRPARCLGRAGHSRPRTPAPAVVSAQAPG